MRVLLVGSGGREHALAWALSRSPLLEELHAAPGSPGIAGACHLPSDRRGRRRGGAWARAVTRCRPCGDRSGGTARRRRRRRPPLVGDRGVRAVGGRSSDRGLEDVCQGRHGSGRRPARGTPARCPRVRACVKADGLAAGKGVVVCLDDAQLAAGLEVLAGFSATTSWSRSCSQGLRCRSSPCATVTRRSRCPRAGLQACLRRRPRAEHRRDGLVSPVPGARGRWRRPASSSSFGPCSRSSRAGLALRRDALRRVDAHR